METTRTGPDCTCGKPHVIGYVRLSNLTDASLSPEEQRRKVRGYCELNGWHLVDIVEDLGESGSGIGKGLVRPGLQSIRANWQAYDGLVCAKLDRLARNVSDFAALIKESRAEGCNLVVIHEGLDLSTPQGEFVAHILMAFAAMEAAVIRERILSMREAARLHHHGRFMGGMVPFGFKPAPLPGGKGRTLTIDETEAELIREAARRVLAGESLYAVTNDWGARGITTKHGKRWIAGTLHGVLTGYAVIGGQAHKREPLRDENGDIREVFPAILDRTTWGQLRTLLERQKATPRKRKPAQLLAGIAVCGSCGTRMYSRTQRTGTTLYECNGRRNGNGCKTGTVTVHNLDAEVERQLMERAGWHLVVKRVEEASDQSDELATVEDAIRDTTRRLAEDDDETPHLARLAELKARRTTLRASPTVTETAVPLGTLESYWAGSDFTERVRLLRDLLTAVKISGSNMRGAPFDPSRVALDFAPGVFAEDQAAGWGVEQAVIVVGGPFRDPATFRDATTPEEFRGKDVRWFPAEVTVDKGD